MDDYLEYTTEAWFGKETPVSGIYSGDNDGGWFHPSPEEADALAKLDARLNAPRESYSQLGKLVATILV